MCHTNTMGYIPIVMDWPRKDRGKALHGTLRWDAEPSANGDAMRTMQVRAFAVEGDSGDPWDVALPGVEVENSLVGRLGMGDDEARNDFVGMLDWAGPGAEAHFDDECGHVTTHGAFPFEGEMARDGEVEPLKESASWKAIESDRGINRRWISVALPFHDENFRVPAIGKDFDADFLRRLSEEDRDAQAEILGLIKCADWGIRDVRLSSWKMERRL